MPDQTAPGMSLVIVKHKPVRLASEIHLPGLEWRSASTLREGTTELPRIGSENVIPAATFSRGTYEIIAQAP